MISARLVMQRASRLCGCLSLTFLFLLLLPQPSRGDEATLLTVGPLFDYRAAESSDYRSLHLLGPLFKYERKGGETEFALRPFVYRASDENGLAQTEVLYPLATERSQPEADYLDVLHLLNYDFGARERGSSNQFYLFPFLFYGDDPEYGHYAAVFPLGGTLHNWFGRDRITFALFPLYSRTERGTTITRNLLWPFFSLTSGEGESGFSVWPLYGQSRKEGVYRKRFFLWPFFFDEELGLDSDAPLTRQAVLPLWFAASSREVERRSVLWPFFNWTQDRRNGYEQWDFPWPLVRITTGSSRHGLRLLPLYADETIGARRKRWFLWPVYQIEELATEELARQRHRVLFFLYSDLLERKFDSDEEKRRVDLWPLFSYHRQDGVSRFDALALLDAFFPDHQAIERSWSPLWRLYQQRWDRKGNLVISVLWNLYWLERQGEQLAWEFFPVAEYRHDARGRQWQLLKGLVGMQQVSDEKCLKILYLPRVACWSSPSAAADSEQVK